MRNGLILYLCFMSVSACATNGGQAQGNWVLWTMRDSDKQWFAVDGYPTHEACVVASAGKIASSCFPGTVDPRDPSSWILWGNTDTGQFPIDGHPSYLGCELAQEKADNREKQKGKGSVTFTCYPSNFDPRR
jgi:hypothetical protein